MSIWFPLVFQGGQHLRIYIVIVIVVVELCIYMLAVMTRVIPHVLPALLCAKAWFRSRSAARLRSTPLFLGARGGQRVTGKLFPCDSS